MPTNIKISSRSFNEFAAAMEKLGRKQGENSGIITLEKDDKIIDPIDWRSTTVRKDCLIAIARLQGTDAENIVEIVDKVFQYVVHGKPNESEKE